MSKIKAEWTEFTGLADASSDGWRRKWIWRTSYVHGSTPDRRRAFSSYAPWVTAHTDALHPRHNESSSEEDDADDRPAVDQGIACCSDWYDFHVSSDTGSSCRQLLWGLVCLIGQRDGVALVPCGHARFCATCVDRVVSMGTGCPICRADIQMVTCVCN